MINTKRAVALGYFDGLHTGHAEVLGKALGAADCGLVPAVMLFDVPPAEAVTGIKTERLLSDNERDSVLKRSGFELLYVSFKELRDMSPREFVEDVLCRRFNAGEVFCGFNYSFGKNGEGNVESLKTECAGFGINVNVSGCVTVDGETVSSSAIRKLISDGDIERANKMLGYSFGFTSPVFSGDHRGRLLGAPTINQYLPDGLVTPKFGVYAAVADINGTLYSGVTNIGKRPTFDGVSLRSETFILGFDGDLYGKNVTVRLVSFIRGEMKFPSADALKEQIVRDERAAAMRTEKYRGKVCGAKIKKIKKKC